MIAISVSGVIISEFKTKEKLFIDREVVLNTFGNF